MHRGAGRGLGGGKVPNKDAGHRHPWRSCQGRGGLLHDTLCACLPKQLTRKVGHLPGHQGACGKARKPRGGGLQFRLGGLFSFFCLPCESITCTRHFSVSVLASQGLSPWVEGGSGGLQLRLLPRPGAHCPTQPDSEK